MQSYVSSQTMARKLENLIVGMRDAARTHGLLPVAFRWWKRASCVLREPCEPYGHHH